MPHPKDNTVPLVTRFWSRVDKNGPVHPTHGQCWTWTGFRLPNGYGQISWNACNCYAHRVSYEMKFGIAPGDLHVLHKCDNPSCVNPAHLFLGTCDDNRRDSVAKDRHARGERQWCAELTDEAVIEMRKTYRKKSRTRGATALGRKFGVSGASAWEAIIGKTWKHLNHVAPPVEC